MDIERFNYLLKHYKTDKSLKTELCKHCLINIKRRLNATQSKNFNLHDAAHDILANFLKYLPKKYIAAPFSYINRITDNYMASHHEKYQNNVPLEVDLSYEQAFDSLDKMELKRDLVKCLGEPAASIVYLRTVEEMSEKDIAEKLDLKYNNVRQIFHRSKIKLKKFYSKRNKDRS